jgi:sugar diacid utilization regulator
MKDIKEYIKPILIIVFATVISINLGFKKTLSLAQSYNNNKATLETIDQIPKKLSRVQYDIQKLDSLLNSTDTLINTQKRKF